MYRRKRRGIPMRQGKRIQSPDVFYYLKQFIDSSLPLHIPALLRLTLQDLSPFLQEKLANSLSDLIFQVMQKKTDSSRENYSKQEIQEMLKDIENSRHFLTEKLRQKDLEEDILDIFSKILEKQLQETPPTPPDSLKELQHLLGFQDEEMEVIRFFYRDAQSKSFFFTDLIEDSVEFIEVLSVALNQPVSFLQKLLNSQNPLSETGMINARAIFQGEFHFIHEDAVLFLSGYLKIDQLRQEFILEDDGSSLFDLASFPLEEQDRLLMLGILKTNPQAKILVHGVPGTGKTQFCRSLIKNAGFSPVFFNNDFSSSSSKSSGQHHKKHKLSMALKLLKPHDVLIVDEADSILNTSWLFHQSLDKGWINRFLDTAKGKMIFISNTLSSCEDSVLRRFDYHLKFAPLSESQRMEMWKHLLKQSPLKNHFTPARVRELSSTFFLNSSSISLALENTARLFQEKIIDEKKIFLTLKGFLKNHEAALPSAPKENHLKPVISHYQHDLIHTDTEPELILNSLKAFARQKNPDFGVNLLFWGLPGTGKTEFAKYLAGALKKPFIYRRYSELSSMFVGETEKNLARAFNEAQQKNAILMLDEVDSFLNPRESAQRSWEKTQTNELLTRMENFKGIFIACTNLLEGIDSASLRRFSFKVQFKPARKHQRLALVTKIFELKESFFLESEKNRIENLEGLTPGDVFALYSRMRFLSKNQLNPKDIAAELEKEIAYKKQKNLSARPLGFHARS